MGCLGLLKEFIVNTWSDLYLIGKILLVPLYILFGVCLLALGVFELVTIDIWAIFVALCSKSISVSDVVNTLLMLD
jgi:hypothetical protein